MYNIGIPEIIITDRLEDDAHLSIKYLAEADSRPVCVNPDCSHKLTPNRHDSTSYLLHDIKSEGKLVYIDLKIRRYKCPECQAVFPDVFTFFTKKQHMTHRLKEEFVNRCIKGESFRYIANDYSIDSKTVAAAFQEYVDKNKKALSYSYTPVILGIDEAHIDDHYRLVLTDIKEQKLLDMKRDNHHKTVTSFLRSLDPNVCKCITMDFAPGYASAVEEVLPNALIVIDKFHAVQEINKCLDNVRKSLQREHAKNGESITRFKYSRKLFMTNWEDLSSEAEIRISKWFNEIPELYSAYMCKEMFRDIYLYAKTKSQAREMFDKWLTDIPDFPEFSAMKKTMTKRKEHILNYWDYNWTNAYTESINNAIKTIEKRGRGYRFERLRELCILEINKPKPQKFNPRTANYSSVTTEQNEKRKNLYVRGLNVHKPEKYDFYMAPINIMCSVGDLFDLYIEVNNENQDKENTIKRLLEYHRRLIQKHLVS